MEAVERVLTWCRMHYLPSPLAYSSATPSLEQKEQDNPDNQEEQEEQDEPMLEAGADVTDRIEEAQPDDSAGQ